MDPLLGKDEVAGSNPAISSIEILQILAGFRFVLAIFAGFEGGLLQIEDLICSLDWFCQTKCQFLVLPNARKPLCHRHFQPFVLVSSDVSSRP